jgi:phosphoribosylformimino-5-aminoimidazole carboxamide ribotide isomerase
VDVTSGFEILPAIDLRNGRVVRLQQGDFARESVFSDDPVAVARAFVDAGARWLHVVDLDGARSGAPVHGPAISRIVEAVGERTAVEVAGGLRDERSVARVLAAGAARVVVGTAALADPVFAARLVSGHGAASIAVAIDVREGVAVGHGWQPGSAGVDPDDAVRRLADAGVTTFEVTAIDRDGLLDGPDLALCERLVKLDLGSIIASGGIATIADVLAVRGSGAAGVIIGRAIYEGRLDLREMLAVTVAP